ncbi:hypothetical protein PAECIP111893_00290 [Paenibacillus plantiphilus]|uniref:DUF3102 domain-containing protein n=1 Tax=Paenibacillus plantiphilus TaxID=2905650 RepID=A0ABN8FUS6_9BACL|nr:DUF3102 domain-containing protein [Paenibacillus plantiphilus]CAH1190354.1 hypothetical protein PAECIP111893_00290 [Paenibacillus plantiphilus]
MTRAKQAAAIVPALETTVAVRTPEVIAAEIRSIDQQARQIVLQSSIEIGRKLTEAKALVTHGEWGGWLQANVSYSQSTANNFMRVSEEYANSPNLTNLNYSQAVALLSVSAEDREQFAAENDVADMSVRELQAAIKGKNDAEKALKEEQERQEEQKAKFDEWSAKQAQEKKELNERLELSKQLQEQQGQQLSALQAELEQAKAGGDDKAVAKVKTDLRKAEKAKQEQEKKVADLQTQFDALKAEAEKAATELVQRREQELTEQANKEKQAMQEQLDKLNQQLARSNNESYLKAKIIIQQMVIEGDTLVKAIAAVTEPKEQAALKAAAANVVDKLRGLL